MPGSGVVLQVAAFGRVLREAGVEVGPARVADALHGLDRVDLSRRDDVYWTLRQTLVSRREELEQFDRAFAAWFEGRLLLDDLPVAVPRPRAVAVGGDEGADGRPGDLAARGASADEVLRQRDFATLEEHELAALRRLLAAVDARRPLRRTHRLRRHPRGRALDVRALLRASLATGGEPLRRTTRRRTRAPRKLVVLCDVSGSMEPYARALLLFLHAIVAGGHGAEAFAFGTELTRLTPELAAADPEIVLRLRAARPVDWAGGTRIGAALKRYNDDWGRRGMSRGAIVVIVSDGWERQGTELLAHEMARLSRQAYAVVWVNPLKGDPDYQPLAAGMRAALPYVDRFLSGQNLADLERLADVLPRIDRRHGGAGEPRPSNIGPHGRRPRAAGRQR